MMLCQEELNMLDPEEVLFLSHYDLVKITNVKDVSMWKRFLMDAKVSDWLSNELMMFKELQLRKAIKNATDNTKSVGVAQMISALDRTLKDDSGSKEGNTFVYCYVPLNDKEMQAPNVVSLDTDVFNN